MEPIAIIGLAHRFPGGATTPAKLWEVLNSRRDLSREPAQDRLNLQKFYNINSEHHGSSNVTKSYFLDEDPRLFDTTFFNVSPLEAEAMDPQQRMLLETVYEAMESAGTPIEKIRGSRCSVFVGVMTGDYETIQYRDTEDLSHYTASGTSRAILANRISYFFDLSAASICLDTACSSSLVALHLAVQDLRGGAAETAIVAGTNLIFGPDMYISESKLRMLSPTGKCQMWDSMADGYARGEGVAALLLKPLSKALRDNDPIQGIIRNSGVNSDGRTPGITMPSALAQAKLATETYRAAGLDPAKMENRCQYFEAHGTGTQAGDPAEARGIFETFFSTENATVTEPTPLYVGSIKTVAGHLEGCAGLAGVIKVLLAMKHDTIPPNLHLKSLNPKIQPYGRFLQVPTEATPWPTRNDGQPKRASVNSFGFGGTNAHVILESYESKFNFKSSTSWKSFSGPLATPVVVSGHTQNSLLENIRQLTTYLHDNPTVNLEDVAWTLWERRSQLSFRKSFNAKSRKELLESLEKALADSAGAQPSLGTPASTLVSPSEGFGVLGIFTGQGAQWTGMGKELLLHSPIFRTTIDECDACLSTLPDGPSWSLKEELLAEASQSRISQAEIAQPATTAVEIGLARVLEVAGIKFSAVVGHSSGEIAALYAAGILSLADAIRIAFYRGLYAKLAGRGSMLAVGISGEAAQDFCREGPFKGRICLAAKNSPSSVTLSGDVDAIQEAKKAFDERKIFARVLKTDKAYHSPHMEACSEAYLQAMRKCGIKPLKTGECIWISSVDGTADRYWNQDLDDLSGPYWVANMVKPVLFSDAITTALTNGGPFDVSIEVGPHPALKGPVNQTVRPHLGKQLPYTGSMNRGEDCVVSIIELQGFLWSNFGAAVLDFDGFQRCWQDQVPTPMVVDDLPTYSWDHGTPIWRESRISLNHRLRSGGTTNGSILLGHRCPDDSDWEPRWRNFLNLKELPWLRGHSFQGEVLFPSAGYIAMMLEVAQFLSSDKSMSLIEIEKLTLERPLKVDEGPRPVEMVTSAKVTHKDDKNVIAEISCYVCSDADSSKMDRTCFGSISVSLGTSDNDLLPPRVDPLAASVPPVGTEQFYNSVKQTRLEYEGLFKRLESMRRADGIATATASWLADEIKYGNLYHPALIDVALQPVFAAFNAPTAERLWTAYLPQSFERITVNPRHRLTPSASGKVEVLIDAFSTVISAIKIAGDISVYSTHDDFNLPFIQLEGMALAALGRPDASNDRILFAETKWEPDLLEGDEPEVDFNPPQNVAVEESERVALFFCRKLLMEASKVGVENLKPHEKMMFVQLSDLKNTVEKGPYRDWATDTRETIDAIVERNKDQVDFELLRRVGDESGSVFRNEKQMVHVLFADDKLSHFYREGLGLRNAQRQISAYLSAISHRYPNASILELGAGTGASTSAVFDTIGDHFGSYTFTDVSLAFFPEAQKKFAAHVHKMTFKKLDIGQPFEEQGFDTPAYDIIIAANVLHVSEDIQAVLCRVRGLLKPGGFLVVTEPTSDHLRIQVIMGGLEGWWLARDNCRRFGPVATIETWDEKLRGAGFTGVDLFSRDQKQDELHTFTSFVSQATDPSIDAFRQPFDNIHMLPGYVPFTVIGGSTLATSKIVRFVRDRLASFGNHVVHFPDIRSIKPSDLPAQSLVLCFAELDQPIFKSGMDDCVLHSFKRIIEKARGALFLTKNAATSNPYSNMLIGLCRGLRAEQPALGRFLQVLDIDGTTKLDGNIVLQRFLQLTMLAVHHANSPDYLWSLETELSLRSSKLFIPRIEEYKDPNERTNSARRQIMKDVTSETHIIEVSLAQAVVEAKASSKISLERIGLDTIENTFSCLAQINLLPFQPPQYLCVGTRQKDSKSVIVLSPTNSSVLQVPRDQTFSANIDSKDIAVMSIVLAAEAWVRSVPHGYTIWLHDVDRTKRIVLGLVAKKHGVEIFATSTDPTCDNFIPPRAPMRMLKALVPRKTATVIFEESVSDSNGFDLLAKVSSFTLVRGPSSGRFWDCPTTQPGTKASQLLEEAYRFTVQIAESRNLGEVASVVPIGEAIEGGTNTPTSVFDWRQARSIPIRAELQPVKPQQLFRTDKTYFMVGLTGDVGISICSWMIAHGVQYVVLASRNPQVSQAWIDSMSKLGAKVVVMAMDVTNPDRVRQVVDQIAKTMPPVAGVCNGSMVLSDQLFMHMDVESMQTVLRPKIDGSINLDRAFPGPGLDFFIMLSSTGSVIGTPGQSNYHMANKFMSGLAADRRRRGLAGSVIDVGMISDTGYVTRQDPIVAKKLRSMCVLALCEAEVHTMFAEGILAGRPGFASHSELIAGLAFSDNEAERPFWAHEPRFRFYVRDKRDSAIQSIGPSVIEDLRAVLQSANDEKTIFNKVREAFAHRLESLLQLPHGSAKMELPLVSLGLDSLLAMEVQTWFLKILGTEVSVLRILSGATADSISREASTSFNNKSSTLIKGDAPEIESHPEVKTSNLSIPVTEIDGARTPSTAASGTTPGTLSASPPTPITSVHTESRDEQMGDYFAERKMQRVVQRTAQMSFAQARLWFLQGFLEDPTTYNETSMYELRGTLDIDRLKNAFSQITWQHEILRTYFYADPVSGLPMQAVTATSACPFKYVGDATEATSAQEYEYMKAQRWDLEKGVCLGLTVLRLSPGRHTLILSSHHIAIDGLTWIILLKDLARAYEGRSLPTVPQYVDFSIKQRSIVENGDCSKEVQFWKDELTGLPDALPLFPMSHTKTRRATNQYSTTIVDRVLPKELVHRLKQTSSRLHVTPFHLHFAVLASMVSRLAQTKDFCIGAVDTGRSGTEFSQTAGCFVNIVPVRVQVEERDSFEALCKRSSSKILASLTNSTIPLDALLDELQIPRTARHSPIFQVIINYRLGVLGLNSIGDAELTYVQSQSSGNPYDLGLNITDTPEGTCLLHLAVQEALYFKEAAQSILDCYCRLLESACEAPQSEVAELPMYQSPAPSNIGRSCGNGLRGRGIRNVDGLTSTLSHQIDRVAESHPDLTAIKDGTKVYSYQEMIQKVDTIATGLRARGVPRSDRPFCCLLFEPSADYVFAYLAVLKVGAIVVSLDPTNHRERLASMVGDCSPEAVLHHGRTSDLAQWLSDSCAAGFDFDTTPTLGQDSESASQSFNSSSCQAPAALFYTSGTTGMPKGVVLTHENYTNLVEASSRSFNIRQRQEVILQQTGVTFDLCPFEIFTALSSAGTLVIASKDQRSDPSALVNLIKQEGVTIMAGTPVEFKHIFQHAPDTLKKCEEIRTMIVGGEIFTPQLASQFKQAIPPGVNVFNVYGPTETCIFATLERVKYLEHGLDLVPVGPSLDNVSVYIVDDMMNLVPDGCAGEVCIGGAGVSNGYLARPEMTSQAFVPDPFATAEDRHRGWTTMYRTGDSGYLQPDGSLVVLGRIRGDKQVKIRGIRIELEDIASNILKIANGKLAEVVVTVRGEDQTLIAFVIASGVQIKDAQEYLGSLPASLPLPEYMRPSVIIELEQLPMTRNGKLDRDALNEMPIPVQTYRDGQEALSSLERDLCLIWEKVLPNTIAQSAGIHSDSDFFRLAGNSLLLVNLRRKIQKQWSISVPLLQLFEASTLRSMAAMIRGSKESHNEGIDWEFWDEQTRFENNTAVDGVGATSFHMVPKSNKTVLLVGAAKGLGVWLLKLLLEDDSVGQIHCVTLAQEQALELPESKKLVIHIGSLGEPSLGLSAETQQVFKRDIDIMLHAGAEGSCLNNYESIRIQNVESTKFLANLALARKVPFHYISSPRVILFSGENSYPERPISSHYPPTSLGREGFTSTKWASETYLEKCSAATGLPVSIHRAGYLMSEDADEMDAVNMIHKYSAILKAVPSLSTFSGFIDMCKLPTTAKAILHSLTEDKVGVRYGATRIIHHTEDNVVPVHGFQNYMEARFGHPFRSLSMADWVTEAEEKGMVAALAAFLEAVVERGDEARYPRLLRGPDSA